MQPKLKKRPAWDTKGRLEDMEIESAKFKERILNLENKNEHLNTEVQEKETVVVQNKREAEDLSSKVIHLTEENCSLKRRIETSEDNFKEQLRTKSRQIEDLEYSKSSADRRIKSLGMESAIRRDNFRHSYSKALICKLLGGSAR